MPKGVPKTRNYIGYFGCNNRIVSVAWSGTRGTKDQGPMGRDQLSIDKPTRPFRATVHCTSCGQLHSVEIMWRQRKESDKEPEIQL